MKNWNIPYRSVNLTVFLVIWADSFRISHFTVRTCSNVISSVGSTAHSPLLLLMWLTVEVLLVVDVLLLTVMFDIHFDCSDWLYWQCLEQLRLENYTLSADEFVQTEGHLSTSFNRVCILLIWSTHHHHRHFFSLCF